MTPAKIRSFDHEDVGAAKELSIAAGWNQTDHDWHRVIDAQPDGCLGAWEGERLVGTTTFVMYEQDVAWVGMVLVRPEFRGRGIGTSLVRTAMSILAERGIPTVGLDATAAGRPLYEQEGFCEVVPIVRWTGVLKSPSTAPRETASVDASYVEEAKRFDASVVGVDRGRLLDQLVEKDDAVGFLTRHADETLAGYVFVRPGRNAWQVGPLVARQEEEAKHLLNVAAQFLGGRGAVLDAVKSSVLSSSLGEAGLRPDRRLTRMTFPQASDLLTRPPSIITAGFEWG